MPIFMKRLIRNQYNRFCLTAAFVTLYFSALGFIKYVKQKKHTLNA